MGESNVEGAAPDEIETPASKRAQRFRSEIEFPYADLPSAVELVQTLHKQAGTSCETDELAGWLDQSATGGTFRTRLSAARLFGLVETGQGRVTLTTLGRDILETAKSKAARSDAFLKPKLHQVMYERFRSHVLPPAAAIERQMESLGVSPKQKDRARLTFIKSAQYAGFIDQATGRLIKPGNGPGDDEAPLVHQENPNKVGGGDGGGTDLDLDPLLMALLRKIPSKEEGWPEAKRVRWFRTFAMNVSQVYDDEEPIELKIEAERAKRGE